MLKNLRDPKEARDAMLSLLSTAGTLAGFGLGLVGIINADRGGEPSTIADDILLLSALGFLGSMTLMVLAGFIVVYTLM